MLSHDLQQARDKLGEARDALAESVLPTSGDSRHRRSREITRDHRSSPSSRSRRRRPMAVPAAEGQPAAALCAAEWLELARRSLAAERPQHALAHARKALWAVDAHMDAEPEGAPHLRANILYALALSREAVEAAAVPATAAAAAAAAAASAAVSGATTAECLSLLRLTRWTSACESTHWLVEAAALGLPAAQVALAKRLEAVDPSASRDYYAKGAAGADDGGEAWRRLGVLQLTGARTASAAVRLPSNALAAPPHDGVDYDGAFALLPGGG